MGKKVEREEARHEDTSHPGCFGSAPQPSSCLSSPFSSKVERKGEEVRSSSSSPLLWIQHQQLQLLQHHSAFEGSRRGRRNSWVWSLSSAGLIMSRPAPLTKNIEHFYDTNLTLK